MIENPFNHAMHKNIWIFCKYQERISSATARIDWHPHSAYTSNIS